MPPSRHRTTPFSLPKPATPPPAPSPAAGGEDGENSVGLAAGVVEASAAVGGMDTDWARALAGLGGTEDGRRSDVEEEVGEGDNSSADLGRGRRKARKVDYLALAGGEANLSLERVPDNEPRRARASSDFALSSPPTIHTAPPPTFRRWDAVDDASLRQLWAASTSVCDIAKELDRAKEDVEERLRAFRLLGGQAPRQKATGVPSANEEDDEMDWEGLDGEEEDSGYFDGEATYASESRVKRRTNAVDYAFLAGEVYDPHADEELAPELFAGTSSVAASQGGVPGPASRSWKPWTPADDRQMCRLGREGVSHAEIANRLRRTEAAVEMRLRMTFGITGAVRAATADDSDHDDSLRSADDLAGQHDGLVGAPPAPKSTILYTATGHRIWTEEEKALILRLDADEVPFQYIAEQVGRGVEAVKKQLRELKKVAPQSQETEQDWKEEAGYAGGEDLYFDGEEDSEDVTYSRELRVKRRRMEVDYALLEGQDDDFDAAGEPAPAPFKAVTPAGLGSVVPDTVARSGRPWLPEDDALMCRLAREGVSNANIAEQLDRTEAAVETRLRKSFGITGTGAVRTFGTGDGDRDHDSPAEDSLANQHDDLVGAPPPPKPAVLYNANGHRMWTEDEKTLILRLDAEEVPFAYIAERVDRGVEAVKKQLRDLKKLKERARPDWAAEAEYAGGEDPDFFGEEDWEDSPAPEAKGLLPSLPEHELALMVLPPTRIETGGRDADKSQKRRAFTADEDAQLLSLRRQGYTFTQIGEELGRGASATSSRFTLLQKKKEQVPTVATPSFPPPVFPTWHTTDDASLRELWSANIPVVDIAKKLVRAREDVEERLRAFRLLEAAEDDEENDDRMSTEAGGGIAQDDSSRTSSAEEANGTPRLKDLEESLPARSAHVLPRTSASPTLESIDEEMLETPESESGAPAVSSTTAAAALSTLPAGRNIESFDLPSSFEERPTQGPADRTYRPLWAPQDDALLHRLADQGVSSAKIADQVGRSKAAVQTRLYSAKKALRTSGPRAAQADEPEVPQRKGKQGGGRNSRAPLFDSDEDRQLLALRVEGISLSEIAKRLGRSYFGTQKRYKELTAPAEKAQPASPPPDALAPLPPRRAKATAPSFAELNEGTATRGSSSKSDKWTADEDSKLRRGKAAGETARVIAQRIGRSVDGVTHRWKKKSKAWQAAGLIPASNLVHPTHRLADLADTRQSHPSSAPQPATSSFSPSTTAQPAGDPASTASAASSQTPFPPPAKKQRLSPSASLQTSTPLAFSVSRLPQLPALPDAAAGVVSTAASSRPSVSTSPSLSGPAIYARIAARADMSATGMQAMFSRLRSALLGEQDEEW
ncbi:hypothetical protein JCM10213_002324 [Rhodosporidiobolus nylandii]